MTFSHAPFVRFGALLAVLLTLCIPSIRAAAQAGDGVMSDAEVETLRDTAYVPQDSVKAYTKILDAREKRMDDLLAKRWYPGREQDLHDMIDQMAAIADELNDHLDAYSKDHRDMRKVLPKLVQATERWATTLRAPPDESAYKVVRKIALDAIADTRTLAEGIETEEVAYFKDHPDAAQAEKDRLQSPHAPTARLE